MAKKQTQPVETNDVRSLTIAGSTFAVPIRYHEGDRLTAGEAAALNQTYLEAIRNNNAERVREGKIDQAGIEAYAAQFQFGQRGAVTTDPVEAMPLTVARRKVKAPGLTAAQITEKARELLQSETGEAMRAAARAMVEA